MSLRKSRATALRTHHARAAAAKWSDYSPRQRSSSRAPVFTSPITARAAAPRPSPVQQSPALVSPAPRDQQKVRNQRRPQVTVPPLDPARPAPGAPAVAPPEARPVQARPPHPHRESPAAPNFPGDEPRSVALLDRLALCEQFAHQSRLPFLFCGGKVMSATNLSDLISAFRPGSGRLSRHPESLALPSQVEVP